jgi:hypothetical protein
MIRYLILVLALLLVGIRLAPAQQGNLPKPVQSLPAYPPVRCVTVDWTVESCEWRQVQAAVEGVEPLPRHGRKLPNPKYLDMCFVMSQAANTGNTGIGLRQSQIPATLSKFVVHACRLARLWWCTFKKTICASVKALRFNSTFRDTQRPESRIRISPRG